MFPLVLTLGISIAGSYFTITIQQAGTNAALISRIQYLENRLVDISQREFTIKDSETLKTLLEGRIDLESTKSDTSIVRLSSETNLLISELRRRLVQLEQITSRGRDGQQYDLDGIDGITPPVRR